MKKLIATLTLIIFCSCGSTGQLYVDLNENIDYENGEDMRYRTRFKFGYKINLFEKHSIMRSRHQKELDKIKLIKAYEKLAKEEGWKQ